MLVDLGCKFRGNRFARDVIPRTNFFGVRQVFASARKHFFIVLLHLNPADLFVIENVPALPHRPMFTCLNRLPIGRLKLRLLFLRNWSWSRFGRFRFGRLRFDGQWFDIVFCDQVLGFVGTNTPDLDLTAVSHRVEQAALSIEPQTRDRTRMGLVLGQ